MVDSNNLEQYAQWVETLWISHSNRDSLTIATLGLAGETGEVMEVLKKRLRDGKFDEEDFKKEMGDVMYYWCKILNEFDISPSEVLEINMKKLEDRRLRKVLQGNGDNR